MKLCCTLAVMLDFDANISMLISSQLQLCRFSAGKVYPAYVVLKCKHANIYSSTQKINVTPKLMGLSSS